MLNGLMDAGLTVQSPLVAPWPEVRTIPANHVWVLIRADTPIAWLWDGWAWTQDGERIDLVSRLVRGETLGALADSISRQTRSRHAARLPGLDSPAEQMRPLYPTPD